MSDWTLVRLQRTLRDRTDEVDLVVHRPLVEPTRANYREWIGTLFNFVYAFELRFAFAPDLELRFIEPRIKSGRLSSDLLALGLTRAAYDRLACRCVVPTFVTPVECLGWLFVVERITLQLADLRQRAEPALARELAVASRFFATYEDRVETRWHELGAMIDRFCRSERELQTLSRAALAGLDCLQAATASGPQTVEVELMRRGA
jgi:heme oxygenase